MKNASNTIFLLTAAIILTASVISAENTGRPPGKQNTHTPPDTTAMMAGAYWGFGIGLSIGSVPVFGLWRNALPDTMRHLGITTPFFGADPLTGDIQPLQYRVTEAPDNFNFTLPFSISIRDIKPSRATVLALSFFHSGKQFQSEFYFLNDTLNRRVSLYENLSYYSVALEAAYMAAIPPVFFSINGTQQAYFTVAAGASPINTLTRNNGIKIEAPADDPRMQALADSVQKSLAKLKTNGMSLSWRVGISALRNYGQGGGLEMGLYYGGTYTTYFYNDGERINTGQIDPNNDGADKPLSFLSNRIEFKVTFLMSPDHKKRVSQ
jgi:hypothetical protein